MRRRTNSNQQKKKKRTFSSGASDVSNARTNQVLGRKTVGEGGKAAHEEKTCESNHFCPLFLFSLLLVHTHSNTRSLAVVSLVPNEPKKK
jgi:hypothetical protein